MTDAAPPVPAEGFGVELPVFAGPFRLLAELILEQKVDVCDIAIASVNDRYLDHVKQANRWNLEEATWFLAICAVLLELKVSRLTPRHTELDEEDLLGGSPDLAYARSLELAAEPGIVERVLAEGAEKARPVARETLASVREAMHFS